MPPRLVVAAIIVFWVLTSGWFYFREIEPRFRSGGEPPYTIDLLDQIQAGPVSWDYFQRKKQKAGSPSLEKIGAGVTSVLRMQKGTFGLQTLMRFEKFQSGPLKIQKIESVLRVTEDGDLRGMELKLAASFDAFLQTLLKLEDFQCEATGDVVDGELRLDTKFNNVPIKTGLDKIPLSQGGSVLNPMHLVNKLTGLRAGRTWSVPVVDPLSSDIVAAAQRKFGNVLSAVDSHKQGMLHAKVFVDVLPWDGENVDCHRVDYHDDEGNLAASTWVRINDHIVLQQEARRQGVEFVMRRVEGRKPLP